MENGINVSLDEISPDESICPFLVAQKLLSGKWTLLILCYLRNGALRFSELQKYIPDVTQTALTKSLRKLESDGIITRHIFAEVPPHVEYSLSELGRQIVPVLDSLGDFGVQYIKQVRPQGTICEDVETGTCRCCKSLSNMI